MSAPSTNNFRTATVAERIAGMMPNGPAFDLWVTEGVCLRLRPRGARPR